MRILLTTSLLLCFTITKAQVEKNTILVGGNFNFFTADYRYDDASISIPYKSSDGNINIPIGKAVKKNKVLGVNVGYGFSKIKTGINSLNDTITTKNSNVSISIFYRKYKKIYNDLYFFGESNIGFGFGNRKETYKNSSTVGSAKSYGVYSNIAFGVGYPICKKLQVELGAPSILSLQYNSFRAKQTMITIANQKSSSFSISSAFFGNNSFANNLSLGFRLTL